MIFDSIFWTAYIPFAVVTLWLIAGDWLRRLRKFPAQPRPSQLSPTPLPELAPPAAMEKRLDPETDHADRFTFEVVASRVFFCFL